MLVTLQQALLVKAEEVLKQRGQQLKMENLAEAQRSNPKKRRWPGQFGYAHHTS